MSTFDESKHARGDDGKFGPKEHAAVDGVDLNGGQVDDQIDEDVQRAIVEIVQDFEVDLDDEALVELSRIFSETIRTGKVPGSRSSNGGATEPTIDSVPGPTYDDYQDTTEMFVGEESGLGEWHDQRDIVWSPPSRLRPNGSLRFSASGTLAKVDVLYLGKDMQEAAFMTPHDERHRTMQIKNWDRGGEARQLVSVELTQAEQATVADFMTSQADPDDDLGDRFYHDKVAAWSEGKPEVIFDQSGSVGMHWDDISDAVEKQCPKASEALYVAQSLNYDIRDRHAEKMAYLGTEDWRQDRLERMKKDQT